MQADVQTLKRAVLVAADRTALNGLIENIELEPAQDEWGSDFLRVKLRMKHLDGIDDLELVNLKRAIQDDVGDIDERFPSVRFSDAG